MANIRKLKPILAERERELRNARAEYSTRRQERAAAQTALLNAEVSCVEWR